MPKCYKCSGPQCELDLAQLPTCFTNELCFTSSKVETEYKTGREFLHFERGCEKSGDVSWSTCHLFDTTKMNWTEFHTNCCPTDLCNNVSFKMLEIQAHQSEQSVSHFYVILLSSFGGVLFMLVILIAVYLKRVNSRSKLNKNNNDSEFAEMSQRFIYDLKEMKSDKKKKKTLDNSSEGESERKEFIDDGCTSGASNAAKMCLRTFAKDIQLEKCIGQGRYGQVWKAKNNCDDVAVKIFASNDYASCSREVEVYKLMNMCMSTHILNFIGEDVTFNSNSSTELWLVLDYHPLGSLFDYLSANVVTLEDGMEIMSSIMHGIEFLHDEFLGGKPLIAHRDIKSKNIIMKNNSQCVIADFGLAVSYQENGSMKVPSNYRVGTKRYMAPEILDHTFKPDRFTNFLRADVYSLGLVLWEILNRIEHPPQIAAQPYNVPYQNMVQPDPSFEEMRHVVCTHNRRPEFHPSWANEPTMKSLSRIVQSSWYSNPVSRLIVYKMKCELNETKHSRNEQLRSSPTVVTPQTVHLDTAV